MEGMSVKTGQGPASMPEVRLDGSAVGALLQQQAGPQPRNRRLAAALTRLAARPDWAAATERLKDRGWNLLWARGPLGQIQSLPGDWLLLRFEHDQSLALMRFVHGRWQAVQADGHLAEVGESEGAPVEGVAFSFLPQQEGRVGWREIMAVFRHAWLEVGLASLFVNAGQLILPVFALLVYDQIALNGLYETLWALVAGILIWLGADAGMRAIRVWAVERFTSDLARRDDEALWQRLIQQADAPAGGFSRFLSQYRDLMLARDFVSSSYLLQVADIPFLLLYLLAIAAIAWPMALAVLLLVSLYGAVGLKLQLDQSRISREVEQANSRKLTLVGGLLGAHDLLRTSPENALLRRDWNRRIEESLDGEGRRRRAAQRLLAFAGAMQTLTSVAVLSFGVYLIGGRQLSIGGLIACNLLAGRTMAQVSSLFAVVGRWRDFQRASARVANGFETQPETVTVVVPCPDVSGRIQVRELGKGYRGRPDAVAGIDLDIAPGERIALLGRPGAGKTTLLRCLAGLCRPDRGEVCFDGIPLAQIGREDRNRWLVFKGQDPVVMAGTLEQNLRLSGCRDDERLQQALRVAGLDAEIASGRLTMGTLLEERGANLSGGQRQKIAL
ncbi:MAG: ATP-binding cassette domain-containing protein, partial [Deltaproteobacteria bacterium]